MAQWRALTEIAAPSGQEAKRAEYVEALLRHYGLADVHRDKAGNVIGIRRGTGGGKRVVLDSLPNHRNSEMVATVEAVFRAFEFDPEITDTASNHTSAALRAGIPAVGMGTAPCEGAHALQENCEIEPIFKGIKRTIALAVALSE